MHPQHQAICATLQGLVDRGIISSFRPNGLFNLREDPTALYLITAPAGTEVAAEADCQDALRPFPGSTVKAE